MSSYDYHSLIVPPHELGADVWPEVVIPAPVRDALRLKEGDTMLLTVEPQHGRLVLETEEAVIARLRELVGAAEGGAPASEELLLERRKEAQQEAPERERSL